jgi:RNA polymerase sigma-70 factor (sigma-E family)
MCFACVGPPTDPKWFATFRGRNHVWTGVEMSSAGRTEGFEAFVAGHATSLLRLAYLLTGDRGHAEDLLQDALERAYRHWPRVIAADRPDAYVRQVLIHAVSDRWRKRRFAEVPLTSYTDRAMGDHMRDVDLRDELVRGLRTLPVRQRTIVVLRHCFDMTEADTAEAVGCSVGTVKSQTSRGVARLRELLGESSSREAVSTLRSSS